MCAMLYLAPGWCRADKRFKDVVLVFLLHESKAHRLHFGNTFYYINYHYCANQESCAGRVLCPVRGGGACVGVERGDARRSKQALAFILLLCRNDCDRATCISEKLCSCVLVYASHFARNTDTPRHSRAMRTTRLRCFRRR